MVIFDKRLLTKSYGPLFIESLPEPTVRRGSLVLPVVKFLPWQLTHTCLFHIPGWPMETQEPPVWVIVGLVLVWVVIGFYIVTLAVGPTRRTPYDWVAGSRVVESKMKYPNLNAETKRGER